MAEKSCLTQKNIETLAGLMYLNRQEKGKKSPPWEEVKPETRAKGLEDVEMFFGQMAKLEFEPRPLGEFKILRRKLSLKKDTIAKYIKGWIEKKIEHPKGLAAMFPCDQLADDLVRDLSDDKPANGDKAA